MEGNTLIPTIVRTLPNIWPLPQRQEYFTLFEKCVGSCRVDQCREQFSNVCTDIEIKFKQPRNEKH